MFTLVVGQPLPFKAPPGVGLHYFLESNTLMLVLNIPSPTKEEIEGARKGVFDLRLLACDVGLLCLYRFTPGFPWSDAPFEWWRDEKLRGQQPAEDTKQSVLVVIADSDRDCVKGVRLLTLPENTGRSLYKALKLQAERSSPPTAQESQMWFRGLMLQQSSALAEFAAGHIEPTIGSEGMLRFTFRDKGKA